MRPLYVYWRTGCADQHCKHYFYLFLNTKQVYFQSNFMTIKQKQNEKHLQSTSSSVYWKKLQMWDYWWYVLSVRTYSTVYGPCHAIVLTLLQLPRSVSWKERQVWKLNFNFVLNSSTYKSVYIRNFSFPECLPGGNVSREGYLSWLCMAVCDSGNIHVHCTC
jgi:hypothetical protein